MEADLATWLVPLAAERKSKGESPLVVGFCGVQGIGKTTLTTQLTERFNREGLRTVRISIDDFYLTRAEQKQVAASHPENPYLQARGYPGTHDLNLGEETLTALTQRQTKATLEIPRYNKGAHQGAGDRFPRVEWDEVKLPVDVVILEGWMLGYTPLSASELVEISDPHLKIVNTNLADYSRWTRFLEYFVLLKPENLLDIIDWRMEAEEKMKASGLGGMSEEETRRYVESFLPAHQTYLPRLAASLPCAGKNRLFVIQKDRTVKKP